MEVEEIRAQLAKLEERLDMDADIIGYLIRDILCRQVLSYCNRICKDMADAFISKTEPPPVNG